MRTINNQISKIPIKSVTSQDVIVPEIKVKYSRNISYSSLPKVTDSKCAEEYFRRYWDKDTIDHVEQFMVLFLNRANKIIGWSRVSIGGSNGTVADPKVIFQIALKTNASSIILAHNHPSGNLNHSENDLSLTRKLVNAGNHLDISVLDHLIITSEGYYSFADDGRI